VLSNFATNGAVPDRAEFACEAVPLGDAHFWIIGRAPSGTVSSEPYFGLIDEGSKLNLNVADSNTLSCLPGMTLDFADAIVDWRDTNGAMSLNYAQLGYLPKHSPFETVDELRLVYGATLELLAGEDLNRNGVLDANERNLNGNGEADPGLLEYASVYTREPNFHSDGTALTNVNSGNRNDLQALLQAYLGSSRAGQIMAQLGFESGGGGGTIRFAGLLDFYLRCRMTSAEFGQMINDVATTRSPYTYGRVNVNTASAAVLGALFMGIGVDQNTSLSAAQQLVTYRQQNPNNLSSIAWIVDALGTSNPAIRELAEGDYLTTRSFQFTADIAALGPYGRGYRRVKFIFDTSDGTPKIIYRQDLSRLGWALGDRVRKTWVTKETK